MTVTWLFDFSDTTFSMLNPPSGVGMESAYELAVSRLFGQGSLSTYRACFGLRDRAASEVVSRLTPESSPAEIRRLTKRLVEEKLSHLLDQVGVTRNGAMWPTPSKGFLPFWHRLSELREAGAVETAVISAGGHAAFIERVWQVYDLRLPDVIISADDIPTVFRSKDMKSFSMPRPLPLALARQRLAQLNNSVGMNAWSNKGNVVYCGDNLMRDGGVAAKGAVRHGLFAPDQEIKFIPNGFQFPDWAWVQTHLPGIPGFLLVS